MTLFQLPTRNLKITAMLIIISLLSPLILQAQKFTAIDTGIDLSLKDYPKEIQLNENGDFVFYSSDKDQYYYYALGTGQTELSVNSNEEIIDVAISHDGRIALLLSNTESDGNFIRTMNTSGETLFEHQPGDFGTDDLTLTGFSSIFYTKRNILGATGASSGESIYDTTYVAIPSISAPAQKFTSYGFSFKYIGSDLDGETYFNRCLVSGHSTCSMFKTNGSTASTTLDGPGGTRGSFLEMVNGVGSYIAEAYPFGNKFYYKKKNKGDYAKTKLNGKKRPRFYKRAERVTFGVADINSSRSLLTLYVRRAAKKRFTRVAIGSADRINNAKKMKLLDRITDNIPAGCKITAGLEMNESSHILTLATCKEAGEAVSKVLLLEEQD